MEEKKVTLQFTITKDTVDEQTTETFIRNFVMEKFEFIESAVPMRNDGFGTLLPEEDLRINRAR